jgi:putative ABC transport system ATP-binding protein
LEGAALLINLENIYKTYNMGETEVHALNDVSLQISEGEYVAVVGQSGSGKSTLMNILGCLDTPTSGTYILNGMDMGRMSDSRLARIRSAEIGFIFQGFNLLYTLTAVENVELPLIYQGVGGRERRRRSRAALELVGLGSRLHHKPSELSGGQQQRVAVARALVANPPIILADEPTGNLDSKSGGELLQFIDELHAMGNTIIMITHDRLVAERAKRVVSIMDGMVVSDSPSGEGGARQDGAAGSIASLGSKGEGGGAADSGMASIGVGGEAGNIASLDSFGGGEAGTGTAGRVGEGGDLTVGVIGCAEHEDEAGDYEDEYDDSGATGDYEDEDGGGDAGGDCERGGDGTACDGDYE